MPALSFTWFTGGRTGHTSASLFSDRGHTTKPAPLLHPQTLSCLLDFLEWNQTHRVPKILVSSPGKPFRLWRAFSFVGGVLQKSSTYFHL